ncbi:MAG TPA: YdcF family protein [Streptosporangiaceae bacterium]|nr:YdcF family protein [Streptosporangiaceae bacterium]
MNDTSLSPDQVSSITGYVDIEAPPPDEPAAHIIFGTNQAQPVTIVAERYHRGLAPFVIVTGGVNRHNGIIEGREFYQMLTQAGVPDGVIRVEDRSANTWQNVEFSLPFLHEALALGLPLAAVGKWYHRRAVHVLRTLLPEAEFFYAISWEPVYGNALVTRDSWPKVPDGRRRVIREWEEIPARVAAGSFRDAKKTSGAWR